MPSRRALWIGLAVVVGGVAVGGALLARRPPPAEPARRGQLRAWKDDLQAHAADLGILRQAQDALPAIGEPATGPDVVVIVLDTTRADHLGLYGYDRDTTPRLDAWATAHARVYDRMIADGPWTIPSHASLFTARPPISHGAHGVPPTSELLASALAEGTPTVAGALRARGYRTAAVVGNRAFLGGDYGLQQGFDLWLCKQLRQDAHRLPYTSADRIAALAEAFLADRRTDASVFLFLNFMDPHAPWVPREGYVREPDKVYPGLLPYGKPFKQAADRLMSRRELDPVARATWIEAYDAELRFLDAHVGPLLARLPALGVGEDDYVFVLADHGEYLGEHALVEHGKDVYEPVLHVPLLIRGPGYAVGRDTTPLQHHDVASLILAAAGAPPLPDAERTTDLQVSEQYWSRQRDLKNAKIRHRFDRVRRAFRVLDRKLIVGSDGSEEAYDLAADPEETSPIADAPWVDELRARGEAWVEAHPAAPEVAPQKEADIAALRALGYVE
ncbi:MAG: sulfatase [Myxococcota bacterium]